jgi:RHS repeat-associated protein
MGGMETRIALDRFGRPFYTYNNNGAWSKITRIAGKGPHCASPAIYHDRTDTASGGFRASQACYDVLNRKIMTTSKTVKGWQSAVRTEYDLSGRVKYKSAPFKVGDTKYWGRSFYDNLGRVTKLRAADNTETTFQYIGKTKIITNELGQWKREIKNSMGDLALVIDTRNSGIEYIYDSTGNLEKTKVKDHYLSPTKTIQTVITYDNLGRKLTLSDPDKGNWAYVYNAFGELIKQTDGKGQYAILDYDRLGRLIKRRDYESSGTLEGQSTWAYDFTAFTGVPRHGHLMATTSGSTIGGVASNKNVLFNYDPLGRKISELQVINGDAYGQTWTYNQFGQLFQSFDASGNSTNNQRGIEYVYANGFVKKLIEADRINGNQETYYKVENVDGRGNVTEEHLNGVFRMRRVFQQNNGRLTRIYSDKFSTNPNDFILDLNYTYDAIGNLKTIQDLRLTKDIRESYCYDNLNRLIEKRENTLSYNCATLNAANADYRYDDFGNITYKRDVGNYSYAGVSNKPHAVLNAGGTGYNYDANGSMTSGGGRSLTYTTFDKPHRVSKGGDVINYRYGEDRRRYWRKDTISGNVKETIYVGNVEIIKEGSTTTMKRFIGGVAVVILEDVDTNMNAATRIKRTLIKDQMGSVVSVLKQSATNYIVQEMSYDPWGQRRNPNTWVALGNYLPNFNTDVTQKGFTEHEMVDAVGMIHMNGRTYDPKLGRMLQADPMIQAPTNTQNYNRYSYVLNNPLYYTDPTGYNFFKELFDDILGITESPLLNAVVQIAGCYFSGGAGCPYFLGAYNGAYTYGVTGDFGAALRAGVISGVSAALMGATNGIDNVYAQAAARGAIGGMTSVLQGGKFGHGFASAGLPTVIGSFEFIDIPADNLGAQVVVDAIIGGTISELTGGKFANGAVTAAFSTLLPELKDSFSSKQETIGSPVEGDVTGPIENIDSGKDQSFAIEVDHNAAQSPEVGRYDPAGPIEEVVVRGVSYVTEEVPPAVGGWIATSGARLDEVNSADAQAVLALQYVAEFVAGATGISIGPRIAYTAAKSGSPALRKTIRNACAGAGLCTLVETEAGNIVINASDDVARALLQRESIRKGIDSTRAIRSIGGP